VPCRTFRVGGALKAAAFWTGSSRFPLEVCGFACGSQPWVLFLESVSHVTCKDEIRRTYDMHFMLEALNPGILKSLLNLELVSNVTKSRVSWRLTNETHTVFEILNS
jgi:hypothetical protein